MIVTFVRGDQEVKMNLEGVVTYMSRVEAFVTGIKTE